MGKKSRQHRRIRLTPEQIAAGRASGHLLTVTRKDILVGLLDTAIWLWFHERDPVAIHTLASAGHQSLYDVGKENGYEPVLNRIFSDDELRQAYNVFKHGTSDPNEITDFPPETNTRLLLDASNVFSVIYGSRTPFMATFQCYVVIFLGPRPVVEFDKPSPILFLPENVEVEEVRQWSRLEFFSKIVPLFEGSPFL